MFLPSFLRETFSVLVTGVEHLERKCAVIFLVTAFSVQLMILREMMMEPSKTLKPCMLMASNLSYSVLSALGECRWCCRFVEGFCAIT